MLPGLGQHPIAIVVLLMVGATALRALVPNISGFLALALPIAMSVGTRGGVNPLVCALVVMMTGDAVVYYPAQSASALVIYERGHVSAGEVLKFGLWMTLVGWVAILAVALPWWGLVGEPLTPGKRPGDHDGHARDGRTPAGPARERRHRGRPDVPAGSTTRAILTTWARSIRSPSSTVPSPSLPPSRSSERSDARSAGRPRPRAQPRGVRAQGRPDPHAVGIASLLSELRGVPSRAGERCAGRIAAWPTACRWRRRDDHESAGWARCSCSRCSPSGDEAAAQSYRWVDEQGNPHYVGRRDQVPERYRSQLPVRAAGRATQATLAVEPSVRDRQQGDR